MIKVDSIEVPIYDMEEFHTYIEDRLGYYRSLVRMQQSDPDDSFDDDDVAHWTKMYKHYGDIIDYIESKYTDGDGELLPEFNVYE